MAKMPGVISDAWSGIKKHAIAQIAITVVSFVALIIGAALTPLRPIVYSLGLGLHAILASFSSDLWSLIVVTTLCWVLWLLEANQRLGSKRRIWQPGEFEFKPYAGVLWKVYPRDGYIEQGAFCTCCASPSLLNGSSISAYEQLTCPVKGTKLQVAVGGIAASVEQIWHQLTEAWIRNLEKVLQEQFVRIKELYPDESDAAILDRMTRELPLRRVPRNELRVLKQRFPDPFQLFSYIGRNEKYFRKYLFTN